MNRYIIVPMRVGKKHIVFVAYKSMQLLYLEKGLILWLFKLIILQISKGPLSLMLNCLEPLLILQKMIYRLGFQANFKLSGDGEYVILSDTSGMEIDQFHFQKLLADQSAGKFPDGTGKYTFFNSPTPNKPNQRPFARAKKTRFSTEGKVHIACCIINSRSI